MSIELRNRTTDIGRLKINYYSGGEGEPLVIIHGGASSSEAWIENASELTRAYAVYVPDLPGFGRSAALAGDYYLPELVNFIDDFTCSLGLDKFHLIGHSLGGAVALNYVLTFPQKVKKLVLISSMCLTNEVSWWIRLFSHSVFVKTIGFPLIMLLRAIKWLFGTLFRGIDFVIPLNEASIRIGSGLSSLGEYSKSLINRVSEVVVPTLLVWGGKDPILPAKQAYDVAELIPLCQVKVFEGGGHNVYRQRIDEFSQLVTDFLG
ncbi:alpha/beta fold hydrolase [Chloroflexota bacterium]